MYIVPICRRTVLLYLQLPYILILYNMYSVYIGANVSEEKKIRTFPRCVYAFRCQFPSRTTKYDFWGLSYGDHIKVIKNRDKKSNLK